MTIELEDLKTAMAEDGPIKDFLAQTTATMVTEAVKTQIDEATNGLKSKNTELLTEKKNLQDKLAKIPTAEELKEFETLKKQLDSSADAKLIAEGKMDEVILKRTERSRLDFETKEAAFNTEITTLKESNSQFENKYTSYVIDDSVKKAALASGVLPAALDDVVRRTAGTFTLEADGTIVARDKDGALITTDGVKTMTPELYIAQLKESAPHFWPASKGGGLGGSDKTDDALAKTAATDITSYMAQRRKQKTGA